MAVSDGQAVNAAITNSALMSRTTNTSTTGVVDLNNTSDVDSGAQVTNSQQALNETFDAVGMTGIDDATRKNYSSNNVVTDGDSHKVAIGKLDADSVLKVVAPSSTDNAVAKYDGAAGQIQDSGVIIDDSNNVTGVAEASVLPVWKKFTVTHTALQAAALTNDIELHSLVALGVVHSVVIKPTVQFAGTGITGYVVSVGLAAALNKYTLDFNVKQAVGDAVFEASSPGVSPEDFGSATSIRIAATSVGANLDQSTAGSVDVWLLLSKLP